MNDSFFAYLHRLELIAFFSGFPLIYAAVLLVAGNPQKRKEWKKTLVPLLSYSYALVATLYLGFEMRSLYPDYSIGNIKQFTTHPFLVIWGLMAILFWIPALAKRPILCLLHSLVFFILLIRDLVLFGYVSGADKSIVNNDMKLYTSSILLNIVSFIAVTSVYYLLRWFKSLRKSSRLVH